VSTTQTHQPRPWDGQDHQQQTEYGDVFQEVGHLSHACLLVLDRPEIMDSELRLSSDRCRGNGLRSGHSDQCI
jgi:hypothetical protein